MFLKSSRYSLSGTCACSDKTYYGYGKCVGKKSGFLDSGLELPICYLKEHSGCTNKEWSSAAGAYYSAEPCGRQS